MNSEEKEYLLHGTIPADMVRRVGLLVDGAYARAFDPCVGDAKTFYQLAKVWKASAYGVEPEQMFSGLARQALGFSNFLAAQFEDCVLKGFPLAYVNPPIERRREINWIKRVWESMIPGGVAIWILPEKTTKQPEWLMKFSQFFGDTEAFKFPDKYKGPVPQLIIRTRPREQEDLGSDEVRLKMLLEAVEGANPLPDYPTSWELPKSIRDRARELFVFKVRALEWDDVFKDLMETSYPHLEEIMELPQFDHFEEYKTTKEALADPEKTAAYRAKYGHDPKYVTNRPKTISEGTFVVWVDSLLTAEKEVMFMSMCGRLSHIRLVEMMLKGGKQIKAEYTSIVLDGKMRHWKKVYQNFVFRLPISGAYQSIWVHTNLTGKMARSMQATALCQSKPKLSAKLISAASGLPIMPEWVDDLNTGNCFQYLQNYHSFNIDACAKRPEPDAIKRRLTQLAKVGNLDEPTPGASEIIRPLMPPSAGGYAQLALQQFINNYPLSTAEGDKFVLYAKPMIKEDVEVSDVMNDKVEITTVTRKDAVHVELFHYAGPRAGEWEVFETGAGEDEEENGKSNPSQTP